MKDTGGVQLIFTKAMVSSAQI
ncbi:hypothetical protein IEO21_09744 [Rhodonia placenta]|uniref:Uncharacterized protein n=1 Tax=Rhodonia placenta TaxID=104341 RepID=A0A8H7NTX8_9APHY|nr:hypothetical protein IEO21_09744 [Postia placenta]